MKELPDPTTSVSSLRVDHQLPGLTPSHSYERSAGRLLSRLVPQYR